jgi:hypothetical protein
MNEAEQTPGERRYPPTPHGSARELIRNPLNYFLSITREYGDIVCYRPVPDPAYLLNHPEETVTKELRIAAFERFYAGMDSPCTT